MFLWPPSLPTPPHWQLIGSQFCIVSTFYTLSATTDTPLPKEKSFVPIVSLNFFEALNCFLLFCLSVFRVFPLEWTESNPNFLLTLLDQFNIEGKEEIKDLFVKVGSKAIFFKFLSLTLRPNFDYYCYSSFNFGIDSFVRLVSPKDIKKSLALIRQSLNARAQLLTLPQKQER